MLGHVLWVEDDDIGHHAFLQASALLHGLQAGISDMLGAPVAELGNGVHQRYAVFPRNAQCCRMGTGRAGVAGIVFIRGVSA